MSTSVLIIYLLLRLVIEGTVIQYIGLTRTDAKGLVQVGIRPEILEETLANTEINVVLQSMEYGDSGYIYAIDAESGSILSHPNETLIGKGATEAGLSVKAGKGRAKIDGTRGYYLAEEYENMIIGTFLPTREYYRNRLSQTMVVSTSMCIIFLLLIFVINKTIDVEIITGINHLAASMKRITDGDFEVVVEENRNPEFIQLSRDINIMVESIRKSIKDNEQLLVQQQSDMEHTLSIFENIKEVCGELGMVSQKTLSSANDIFHGTEQQKQSIDDLEQVMETLANELNTNADASVKVTKTTEGAVSKILDT